MYEILERITSGKGEEGDIEKLETLAESITGCALWIRPDSSKSGS